MSRLIWKWPRWTFHTSTTSSNRMDSSLGETGRQLFHTTSDHTTSVVSERFHFSLATPGTVEILFLSRRVLYGSCRGASTFFLTLVLLASPIGFLYRVHTFTLGWRGSSIR